LKKIIKTTFLTPTTNTIIQFIRYAFVGGIAAIVNIGTLYILTDMFNIYYLLSNIFGFAAGLTINYILSTKFIFNSEKRIKKDVEFSLYATIGVVGLVLDTVLLWILTDLGKIYYLLSKIASTVIVFIWNFGARKMMYSILGKKK